LFKKFQTEKERIDKYQQEKTDIEELLSAREEEKLLKRKQEEEFVQPQMMFTARNRIERVFDAINEHSFGKLDRNLLLETLNKKMKKSFHAKNYTELLEHQLPKYLRQNINKLKKENVKEEKTEEKDDEDRFFIKTETNFFVPEKIDKKFLVTLDKNFYKRNQSSTQAKKILGEYHHKTHFRGASNFALMANSGNNSSRKTNNEVLMLQKKKRQVKPAKLQETRS